MKKKIMVMMMVAFILVAPIFANGSKEETSSAKSAGPVTLSVFGFKTAAQAEMIKTLIAEYNEANPDVNVTYEGLTNPGGYQNVLTTRLASGQGDDVFFGAANFLNKVQQSGYTVDLSDEPVLAKYTQNMKIRDAVPGLAIETTAFGMYVNNDLLREVGIDSVPQTREEWLEDCQILKDAGKTPIVAGASDGTGAAITIVARGLEDVYLNSDDKEAKIEAIDNGEIKLGELLKPGFELDQELIEKGYVDGKKAIVMNAFTDGTTAFAKGDVGFFLMGSWAVSSIKKAMPDVDVTFEGLPVSDVAPIVLNNPTVYLCINKDSKHQAEARKFIEYMTTTSINNRYIEDQNSFTILSDGQSSNDPMLKPVAAILKSGRAIPWADISFSNVNVWDLSKQFGANVFAGVSGDDAARELDEANELNLSLL